MNIYPVTNALPLSVRQTQHNYPKDRLIVLADPFGETDEVTGLDEHLILLRVRDARRLAERLLQEARLLEEAIAGE